VAITNINLSASLACPGQTVSIWITAKNNGTVREESFNVSVYWGEFFIETRRITELPPGATKQLKIDWPIPSGLLGDERVWANATKVEGEINLENNLYQDGGLKIIEPIYDVAVQDVVLSKNLIGEGLKMNLTVTVVNQGTFTETLNGTISLDNETVGIFTVALTANTTKEIEVEISIPVNSTRLQLYLNYTLKIEITPIEGEADLEDNILEKSWLMITLPGDINGDTEVDIFDVVMICVSYGSEEGEERYNPFSDVDGNGKIEIFDAVIACTHYGEKFP
jgi:hypothetical protein